MFVSDQFKLFIPYTYDFCSVLYCLGLRHYTVRYREKNRKWNYQTCPTSDTVIDNLKPNAVYEFGVQPTSKDGTGVWSKPLLHNISTGGIQGMLDSFVLLMFHTVYQSSVILQFFVSQCRPFVS